MTDLAKTIAPKSDQLNADDLIAGPMTITITGVKGNDDADQPVSVAFEGDGGKPYKPCKSMRRVMVHCWGPDGKTYAGRRMTLYRDEGVQFGGIKVGGIRISHMSHIERETTMALTATRAKRTPYTVKPLKAEVVQRAHAQAPSTLPLTQRAEGFLKRVADAMTDAKLDGIWAASEGLRADLKDAEPELLTEITEAFQTRRAEIAAQGEEPEA